MQTSVGPDNVTGYDAVQRLAHYLVSLASESETCLRDDQVAVISVL